MVVFGLELSIFFFKVDFEYELWNTDFQNFWFFFPLPEPRCALSAWRAWRGSASSNFGIFGLKKQSKYEFWSIKSMDINLMTIDLTLHQDCNFLTTQVDARR